MYTLFIDRYESNSTSETHEVRETALMALFNFLNEDYTVFKSLKAVEEAMANDDTEDSDEDIKAFGIYEVEPVKANYRIDFTDNTGKRPKSWSKNCVDSLQVDICIREFVSECLAKEEGQDEIDPTDITEEDIKDFVSWFGNKYSWNFVPVKDGFTRPEQRLDYLRVLLFAECISYGELAELETLLPYIDDGDVQLLEAAGYPEE